MTPEIIAIFVEKGILGALLLVMGFAYKSERENTRQANERARLAEESRTEDAQKVASMLLAQQEKANTTLSTLSSAIEGQQHAIRAIEQEVRTNVTLMRSK